LQSLANSGNDGLTYPMSCVTIARWG